MNDWRDLDDVELQARLVELNSVFDLIQRVMNVDAARIWLRSPNRDLNYEKPLTVAADGRYQQVVDILLALAEGVTL